MVKDADEWVSLISCDSKPITVRIMAVHGSICFNNSQYRADKHILLIDLPNDADRFSRNPITLLKRILVLLRSYQASDGRRGGGVGMRKTGSSSVSYGYKNSLATYMFLPSLMILASRSSFM